MEIIIHISISVPRMLDGETLDGTQEIPIFYLWVFPKSEIQSDDDYAFVRGNLLTFQQLQDYKVYEDEENVVYELHHLVYSDLRNYVEDMLMQNDSIYFNEDVWTRIEQFYHTFNDRTRMQSCIKSLDQRIDRVTMDMDAVYALAKQGNEIGFEALKPYSRFWKDIDYSKGYGLSFSIDSDYEFFCALNPDNKIDGYFLYHNPTGDRIDIRIQNVQTFVEAHGAPQPRCECENTEAGDHGWHLTLDWLKDIEEDTIISYIPHVCSYSIDGSESPTYYYPLDDETYHVEVDWSIVAGNASYRDENIWLIHNATQDRCNVRTEDMNAFIDTHK